MNTPANTREQLLEYAQTLIGTRGCNGFSYRDLAEHVGVKTSSIHYYFPCKDDLVLEAIESYSSRAQARVFSIDASLPADVKLDQYVAVLEGVICSGKQFCMGGMLAADINSQPDRIQIVVQNFFQGMEKWLARVLKEGIEQGTLQVCGEPEAVARAMFATAQGSMLTARVFKDPGRIREAVESLYIRRTVPA